MLVLHFSPPRKKKTKHKKILQVSFFVPKRLKARPWTLYHWSLTTTDTQSWIQPLPNLSPAIPIWTNICIANCFYFPSTLKSYCSAVHGSTASCHVQILSFDSLNTHNLIPSYNLVPKGASDLRAYGTLLFSNVPPGDFVTLSVSFFNKIPKNVWRM